jgi:hypothetical protein
LGEWGIACSTNPGDRDSADPELELSFNIVDPGSAVSRLLSHVRT